MKRLALILLALLPLSFAPGAWSSSGQPVIDGFLSPAGYRQVTNVSAAVGLGTIPDGTKLTLIEAEAQDVRWRDDGVNPTAGVGMILQAGQTLVYNGDPSTLKVIETTASAALNITFYR